MSYTKPPEIPRDHPLALLLERSQKANKLPSCEGCIKTSQLGGATYCHIKGLRGGHILIHDVELELDSFAQECTVRTMILSPEQHFCAAWEPKP
jgi:hypothetical protein